MSAITILIVEDEGLIALHLMEMLTEAGFTVPDPLASGEDLLDQLKRANPPDLILMDIGLGGKIDGIETAREVRKQYTIPIIFLTAYSDGNRMEEAHKVTSQQCLTKPVLQHDLLAAIGKALDDQTGPCDL
jgi:two-component system, response regulator PdtaR